MAIGSCFGISLLNDHGLPVGHDRVGWCQARSSCGGEYLRRARCEKTARRDLCGGCRVNWQSYRDLTRLDTCRVVDSCTHDGNFLSAAEMRRKFLCD